MAVCKDCAWPYGTSDRKIRTPSFFVKVVVVVPLVMVTVCFLFRGRRRWKPPRKAKALKMVGKKVGNPETTKQEDNTSLEETLRAPPARGGEDVVDTRVLRSQTRVSCLGGVPRVACVAFVVVVGTDDE